MIMKRSGYVAAALALALSGGAWAHENEKHVSPEASIRKVLKDYQAAMEERSVEKLAAVVTDDLLILEGTHKNDGWADYRDKHIGPEMAEWKEFKIENPVISRLEVEGALAYVVQEATYTIVSADKTVAMLGAETFILGKTDAGWKIKHVHLSGKRIGTPKGSAPRPKETTP